MDISQILTLRYPGAEWILSGETYEDLEWLSDSPKPTKKELTDQWESVQVEVEQRKADQIARKQAILDRLGLTEDEAKLILS